MQRREDFIHQWFEKRMTMTELCAEYGISRKTGYKWLRRVLDDGLDPNDHSSRPHSNAHAWPEDSVHWFLQQRRDKRTLGPKKLRAMAEQSFPDVIPPAASTIGRWLHEHGLVKPRRRRRQTTPSDKPFRHCIHPNVEWCADFKGHFPVRKRRCYPLTIMDATSRYLIACDAFPNATFEATQKTFERVFRDLGLPDATRTDNGPPFASTGLSGLSQLSVWWLKLGIEPRRIDPGKPQQNGRHERMHLTLKQETASPPQPSFSRQQTAFDRFRAWYNHERPHESLEQTPPGLHYEPSERPHPEDVVDPVYEGDCEARRVLRAGTLRWRGESVFLTTSLADELVALRPSSYDRWDVYFNTALIGELDESRKPWRVRAKKCRTTTTEV